MDFERLRRVSVCLSMILEGMKSISTEEVVSFRRICMEIISYAIRPATPKVEFIYSGSKGEGYDFSTSDEDFMIVCRQTLVFDSPRDIGRLDNPYISKLLMRRDNCNPGFVILQLANRTRDRAIRNSTVMYNNIRIVSSLLYRDFKGASIPDSTGHGPCSSGFFGKTEFDMAFCFECKLWPTEAYDFIHRPRHYHWPAKKLLDKIIERGCHLVAIGDKDSDISHIQWRISFSLAEKTLMHSLNHVQFKVYGLMKIFLKQVLDKEESVKGVICSYFLKTALFYSIESTPASLWRDDLIIHCFWFCFNKIFKWTVQGYCPNYFVPQNNMFRSKVCGATQRNITSVLYKYRCIGWTCLLKCDNFKILQDLFNNPNHIIEENVKGTNELTSAEKLDECGFWLRLCPNKKKCLHSLLTVMSHTRSRQAADIIVYFTKELLQSIEIIFYSEQYNAKQHISNKALYTRARKSEIFSLICSDIDVNRGLLKLATLYYTSGQYKKALCACKTMISRWKPFVVYVTDSNGETDISNKHLLSVVDKIVGQRISYIISNAFAFDVCIHTTKQMYPPELKYDIEASVKTWGYILIPPLPYSAFLSFLCLHKLGNIDKSLSALHDLKLLVNDEKQGHTYIVYNMLAICLEKLGDIRGAMDACIQSILLKPKNNGAFCLIDKFVSCGYDLENLFMC